MKKPNLKKPNKAVEIVEKVAVANGSRSMSNLPVNLRDSGAGMKPGKRVKR